MLQQCCKLPSGLQITEERSQESGVRSEGSWGRKKEEEWFSPITNHQLPITNYQSPITNHQLPIIKKDRQKACQIADDLAKNL